MTSRGAQSGWLVSALLAVTELACTHSRHRLGTLASDEEPGTEGGSGLSAGGAFGEPNPGAGDPGGRAGDDAGMTEGVVTAMGACDVPGRRLALRADATHIPTCAGELESLLNGSGLDAVVSGEAHHTCDEAAGWVGCDGTTSVTLRFDLGANRVLDEIFVWDGSSTLAGRRVQIATLWLASDGGAFSYRGRATWVAEASNCPRPATRWSVPSGEVARFVAISLELEAPIDEGALLSLGEMAIFGRACDPFGTEIVAH